MPQCKWCGNKGFFLSINKDGYCKTCEKLAYCPYCNFEIPKKKRKCPVCKNPLYIRKIPPGDEKKLVTKENAEKIDKEWKEIYYFNFHRSNFKLFGVSDKYFDDYIRDYKAKAKHNPNNQDIIWALYNETAIKLSDYIALRNIYLEMASFLNSEGRNAHHILQQSAKMELMDYKKNEIEKVEVLGTGSSCPICAPYNGKIYDINEALEKMPIPVKGCQMEVYSDKVGFCRCRYVAVINDDD